MTAPESSLRIFKAIATALLSPMGRLQTDPQLMREPSSSQVWFVPDPRTQAARQQLGLLGRMTDSACLLHSFPDILDVPSVLHCVHTKLDCWYRTLPRTLPTPSTERLKHGVPPQVWIIAGDVPHVALQALGFRPVMHWPIGLYGMAYGWNIRIVATAKLAETPDTFFVRLLGPREVRNQALDTLRWSRPCPEPKPHNLDKLIALGHEWRTLQLAETPQEHEFVARSLRLRSTETTIGPRASS